MFNVPGSTFNERNEHFDTEGNGRRELALTQIYTDFDLYSKLERDHHRYTQMIGGADLISLLATLYFDK